MLFTHRGISGPAILQISSYWQAGDDLRVNLLPGIDVAESLAAQQRSHPAAELRTVLAELLPERLAQRLPPPFYKIGPHPLRIICWHNQKFRFII